MPKSSGNICLPYIPWFWNRIQRSHYSLDLEKTKLPAKTVKQLNASPLLQSIFSTTSPSTPLLLHLWFVDCYKYYPLHQVLSWQLSRCELTIVMPPNELIHSLFIRDKTTWLGWINVSPRKVILSLISLSWYLREI